MSTGFQNRAYILRRLVRVSALAGLAATVGFLYIAPQLITGGRLAVYGLPHMIIETNNYSDEVNVYAAKGREVYDGRWPASDLYFDSKPPSIFPALPSLFFGASLYLFNGNVSQAYLGSLFFFSAVIFLIFCWWGWVVFRRRLAAVAVGLVGIFTATALHLPRAFNGVGLLLDIFGKNFIPWVRTPISKLFFSRIDDPLYTYPIYLLAIVLLYLFWQRPSFKRALAAGFLAGLLFHVYFHYAFYWLTVVVSLFLYALMFKRREKTLLKQMLVLCLALGAVAVPYFIEYFMFQSLEGSRDYVWRMGIEIGRGFRLASVWADYVWYLVFAIATYILYWRAKFRSDDVMRRTAVLFWVFLVAVFLVWNVQLITGFVPHPGHWRKAISPVLFFMLINFMERLLLIYRGKTPLRLRKIETIIRGAFVVGLILLIAKKSANAVIFYGVPIENIAGMGRYSLDSALVESWRWVDNNLEHSPKIISDSFLTSVYLGVYTSARPFLALGANTPAPNFDLENRYLAANKLFSVSDSMLRRRLEGGLGNGSDFSDDPFYLYSSYWREKSFDYAFTSSSKPVPGHKIQELLARYNGLNPGEYNVEAGYVYLGPWEREVTDSQPVFGGKIVYGNPRVQIYKLIR